ncbi:MAG: ABC transporter ATP-binding protein [Clostridia bacterium]
MPIDRKIHYIQNKAGSFDAAKDICLYKMQGWFNALFESLLRKRIFWSKKIEKRTFMIQLFSAGMAFVRDGAAYGVLIYMTLHKNLTAADFVFYFGIITQYSNWLLGLIGSYNTLQFTSLGICDLREFLELKDRSNRGDGVSVPKESPEISFENVFYKYSHSENDTLKNINFKIHKGEKIALVGENGAGKTTLVKLLCGLYRPTQGTIKIDGRNITEYNRDEYYTLISVVFQDIYLMPISIAKNIALCKEEKIDHELLENVIRLSGLSNKIQSLPQKENTLLLKSIYEEATDFSGGEKQKLALARALYKQGKIIILDEPTAALDPIAENELYQQYNELTRDMTSLFISHRLSSTRFCDRIFFLNNGEIIEEGTHDELIALNGKYAELFRLQSYYYQEDNYEK